MSTCDRADLIRDYAMDETAGEERRAIAQHITECAECATELDRLQLTTAALRVLPDLEMPRRIAFVSEQPVSWLNGFWNSAARLGFAAACVLTVGLLLHHPAEIRTVVQTADVSKQVNEAVAKAVAQVRDENAQITKAQVEMVERKYQQQQQDLMVRVSENLDLIQKRLGARTMLAFADTSGTGTSNNGAGQ